MAIRIVGGSAGFAGGCGAGCGGIGRLTCTVGGSAGG
jgi:hypothetical protein